MFKEVFANIFVLVTCKTTMKKSVPHAISTRYLSITSKQPPICPIKLTKTNTVAKICKNKNRRKIKNK